MFLLAIVSCCLSPLIMFAEWRVILGHWGGRELRHTPQGPFVCRPSVTDPSSQSGAVATSASAWCACRGGAPCLLDQSPGPGSRAAWREVRLAGDVCFTNWLFILNKQVCEPTHTYTVRVQAICHGPFQPIRRRGHLSECLVCLQGRGPTPPRPITRARVTRGVAGSAACG